jgi:predicted nucleic acid-binding protein
MLVIDANVAVKWVLPEADSHLALALRSKSALFAAPSLLIEEVGNVAWQRARRGELSHDQAIDFVRVTTGLVPLIVPVTDLYEDALRLAIDLDHPIYDCFYIALAIRNQAPLATADRKLTDIAGIAGVQIEPWSTSAAYGG